MMKRYLLSTVLLMTVLVAMAQSHVTGQVIESDSQEPIAQTTVRLLRADSSLVTGAVTDLDGRFRVKAPKAGNYIVQVTCVGFKTFTKRVKMEGDKDVALGSGCQGDA